MKFIGVNEVEVEDEIFDNLTDEQRVILENTDPCCFTEVLYSMIYDDVILDDDTIASIESGDYYGNVGTLSEREVKSVCHLYNYAY